MSYTMSNLGANTFTITATRVGGPTRTVSINQAGVITKTGSLTAPAVGSRDYFRSMSNGDGWAALGVIYQTAPYNDYLMAHANWVAVNYWGL